MNFNNFILVFTLVVLSVSSCTTTRTAVLMYSQNEALELYTVKLPERNFEEICYIQTDGAIIHSPQILLNGLKKKAMELNADAVVNIKFDFQGIYPLVSGTAIKYTN